MTDDLEEKIIEMDRKALIAEAQDDLVEQVARIICVEEGLDPDTSLGGDKQNWLWMEYTRCANLIIDVIKPHVLGYEGMTMPNGHENRTLDLNIDPARRGMENTGIYVRAKDEGKWQSVDIVYLDKASLLRWLRSRGGDNKWAESVVGVLLGHDAFDYS